MTVDDRTRLNLHRKLETVLGPEEADTLMSHLPPVTWSDVATKHDVAAVADILRSEMQALDASLRGEVQAMRGEMLALRGDMQTGDAVLRGVIADAISAQTKWITTAMIAWSAVLLTAVRYLP